MKILSVNASLPKEVPYKGITVTTGIFKEPIRGRVKVNTLNIEGDGQADRDWSRRGIQSCIRVLF